VLDFDPAAMTVTVQPGIVLDHLNAWLKPHGVWFPVDVSTAAQCTLGGMAGNNSCGSRSLAYGNMVHNVVAIDAILSDGTEARFQDERAMGDAPPRVRELVKGLRAIAAREHEEIARMVPKVMRRSAATTSTSGTRRANGPTPRTAASTWPTCWSAAKARWRPPNASRSRCSRCRRHKTLGVVNFPTFHQAMDMTQHIVKLAPVAVELVDRTMIELARDNPAFRPVIEKALIGAPDAILLVEFAGESLDEQRAGLAWLVA
jgi:hypothetical protein